MNILAIDTSCDETSVAVVENQRVLSNAVYSQILIHKKWGGVVPSLAKRAHEEHFEFVLYEALKKYAKSIHLSFSLKENRVTEVMNTIDAVAVTYGPGLAIALEVGIARALQIAQKYGKPLIPVNHMEGHIYSCFAQNGKGNPGRVVVYPFLALLVSGGHTELVLVHEKGKYEVVGETVDDAAGEALDKASKILGLGYPGGVIIEQLAEEAIEFDRYVLPRPMHKINTCMLSFSGLKTALLYLYRSLPQVDKKKYVRELAYAFQSAVFDSLILKTERAIRQTQSKILVVGGGVIANKKLRSQIRQLGKKMKIQIIFPPYSYLAGDNAGMIGVAGGFIPQGRILQNYRTIERVPQLHFSHMV